MVDALTTILGFGALMVASHRGLESLGRLLTLGVTMYLLHHSFFSQQSSEYCILARQK